MKSEMTKAFLFLLYLLATSKEARKLPGNLKGKERGVTMPHCKILDKKKEPGKEHVPC